MAARTEVHFFSGLAGRIECALDFPALTPRGWCLVLHPHPLQGGARDNKVVTTIARACVQAGLIAVRPNFRGVGASEGEFDRAMGETEDMVSLVTQIPDVLPELISMPWLLGGFSFGTAVAAQVYAILADRGADLPKALMLMGPAVGRFQFRELRLPDDVLLVHGEADEVVPLSEAMDWARLHALPVVVVPGASHFFHGKLLTLRMLVAQRLKLALS